MFSLRNLDFSSQSGETKIITSEKKRTRPIGLSESWWAENIIGLAESMKIIGSRHNAAGEVWKAHVLAKLKETRCWICAQVVREVDRDFFWFVSEQYYEVEVVDKMRLAHGFCPTHTRHFLQTGANSVVTTVFSYLTWYVITRLNAARNLLVA